MIARVVVVFLLLYSMSDAAEVVRRNISWTLEGKNDPILQMTNDGEDTVTITFRMLFDESSYRYPAQMDVPSGENQFIRIREILNRLTGKYPELEAKTSGIVQLEFEGTDQQLKTVIVNLNPKSGITAGREQEKPEAPVITSIEPESGDIAGGAIVTIVGDNFTESTQVRFGGMPALRNRQSSDVLVAVAPAHKAGTVDVEVINGKLRARKTAAFRYVQEGPVISSVDPEEGPVRGGTRLTLTGRNFSNDTIVRWNGNPLSARLVNPQTLAVSVPAGRAGSAVTIEVVEGDQVSVLENAFRYRGTMEITSVAPATGSLLGGNTITISGNNFEKGASVLIGGQYATTTYINPRTLAAVVPSSSESGDADIVITSPDGETITRQRGYLYNEPPAIVEVEIHPNPIVRLTTCTITVEARDPEADLLNYEFRIAHGPSGGRITAQFDQAVYSSPNTTGTATIQIIVTDQHGAKATRTVEVEVE